MTEVNLPPTPPDTMPCPRCGGAGMCWVYGRPPAPRYTFCPTCGGKGWVRRVGPRCVKCDRLVSAATKVCPWCGQPNPVPEPGGCFIATAIYGSENLPEVQLLRMYRDVLQRSRLGRRIVSWYYRFSPPLASYLQNTSLLRIIVKKSLDVFLMVVRFTGNAPKD